MIRLRLAALAGSAALLAPVVPPASASSLAFTGIRPGIWLTFSSALGNAALGGRCTANFVFQTTAGAFDPAQQLYLGTAGHCVTLGQVVYGIVLRPDTATTVVVRIGAVVVDDDGAPDFGLIEIDPALNDWVSPSVAHLGGPTGVYNGPGNVPAALTGHGTGIGVGGTPRPGMLGAFNGGAFFMTGVSTAGDSGGPIITADGLAVGQLHFSSTTAVPGTTINGRSIQDALSVAGKPLSTCPTPTPWALPGCPPV
jgi:hypothetical protein